MNSQDKPAGSVAERMSLSASLMTVVGSIAVIDDVMGSTDVSGRAQSSRPMPQAGEPGKEGYVLRGSTPAVPARRQAISVIDYKRVIDYRV